VGLFWIYRVLLVNLRLNIAESENNNPNSDGSKTHGANRNFAINHAMVIHLNAIAMIATVMYGFSLSATLVAGM
jgi:hypothetical protein